MIATLRETPINVKNLAASFDQIKAIGTLPISATAKYVGTVMLACGIQAIADICAATGLPKSTVYRAQKEFAEHAFDIIPEILTIPTLPTSENPTIPTDEKQTEKTVPLVSPVRISDPEPSCARDITTRTTNELPTEVSSIEDNNPPSPPTRKSKPEFGRLQALEAFHAYNDTALRSGIPQASRMTPDRERKIIARLKEFGLDGWHRSLANIERSPFLKGESGDRKWRASLDFMLQPASFAKLHDGGYSSETKAPQKSSVPPRIRFDEDARERIAMEAAGVLN
jgi:hypothetical protein